jgi:hypothetical protein
MKLTINHVFFVFMALVGAAIGIMLVVSPETRPLKLPPYFWILIAMGLFEAILFARGRGAPGTMISMDARVLGFVLALLLGLLIPMFSGSPVPLL